MTTKHAMHIPVSKTFLRHSYKAAAGLHSVVTGLFRSHRPDPRVFYGGAYAGNAGGGPVKIQRLKKVFPEHRVSYNLIYGLSNAPYIPGYALRIQKSRNIPIVVNQSGTFYAGWYKGDCQAANDEMAHGHHLADHVFWQSEFSRLSTGKFLGERAGAGEVLYNAVDTGFFLPFAEARETHERPFRFLVSGKTDAHLIYRIVSAVKGLACARKQGLEASLLIAGVMSLETKNKVQELVNNLDLLNCVSFHGPYRQEQAPSLYNSCDAYLLLTHNDVCPNSVLEAMACGLPVIHTSTGGTRELVGGTGMMIETFESWDAPSVPDEKAVAHAMIEVANNRAALSTTARNRAVEHFDIAHWMSRHSEVFKNLLAERS